VTSFASSRAPGRETPFCASGMDIGFIPAQVGPPLRRVRARLSRPRSVPDCQAIPARMRRHAGADGEPFAPTCIRGRASCAPICGIVCGSAAQARRSARYRTCCR